MKVSKICIIIPVYNAEKYLSDCIESLLCQSYSDFKLILVNDGSRDNSLIICEQYARKDNRIIVLSQENKGAAAARNRGIDCAIFDENADYIGFVDSDDWVHPDYLLKLYEGVMSTGCKISMCNSERCETREYQFSTVDNHSELIVPEIMWCKNRNLCVVPWGKLFASELFADVRFPEEARAAEDEFVSYKVLFACDTICYINEQLYAYYQSENSIMRSDWSPKRMAGIDALEQQLDFFYKNGYRDALQESANTYLFLLNDYINSINSMKGSSYITYLKELKQKLYQGVKTYFTIYRFPIKGNEWVFRLTHPIIGRIVYLFNKIKT